VGLLNSPSCLIVTQKTSFSKILEVVYRPEIAMDHVSGLRSDRGPVVLTFMWFFEVAIPEITIRIFKFVWEILPILYNPHYKPGGKISTPLFSWIWEHFFQKSAPLVRMLVRWGIESPSVVTIPILEKCSHLREKGGVLMLLKTTHYLYANTQYRCWYPSCFAFLDKHSLDSIHIPSASWFVLPNTKFSTRVHTKFSIRRNTCIWRVI
jgi:hypothetical protein